MLPQMRRVNHRRAAAAAQQERGRKKKKKEYDRRESGFLPTRKMPVGESWKPLRYGFLKTFLNHWRLLVELLFHFQRVCSFEKLCAAAETGVGLAKHFPRTAIGYQYPNAKIKERRKCNDNNNARVLFVFICA